MICIDKKNWGITKYFIGWLSENVIGDIHMIVKALKLADGKQLYLTPGKHNELQVAIVEKFGPRYAADTTVLYLGDAANKLVIYEPERLEHLGIPMTTHDKLTDIILQDDTRNWFYLIEAVTSHGPVSHKGGYELRRC